MSSPILRISFLFFFLNARRDSLVIRDTRSKIVSSSRGTQVGDKIVVNRCIGSIAGWFIEHRVQRVNTFSSQIQGRPGWSPWGWCTFSKRSCDERLPTLSACNFFFFSHREYVLVCLPVPLFCVACCCVSLRRVADWWYRREVKNRKKKQKKTRRISMEVRRLKKKRRKMKKNNDPPCPVYYPMKGWYIVATQVGTTKYARFGRIPNPLPPSSPIFFPVPHLLHAFFH